MRSPTENDSPSFTQRMRSRGKMVSAAIRSTLNQFVTSVAFWHISSTVVRLPVWSTSSWER